jgi:proteasome accessory factor A
VKRIFGIETEYGLSMPEGTPKTQVQDCSRIVSSCPVRHVTTWDYAMESPRRDLRGFVVDHLNRDPIDARWDGSSPSGDSVIDCVLINGARFYNDHGHPEYATPECLSILDLVAHDLAGERIALAAAASHGATLYKNNSDYSGASYGTHENYLVPRSVDVGEFAAALLPLLVTRQLFCGAGKVGSETRMPCEYQLSQRADFLTEVWSVDTLYRRPIFNTRDEPHADASRWLRLHVICGDANRSEWSTAMKVGMTRIAIELAIADSAPRWRLADPVKSFRSISTDPERVWRVELESGGWTTAVEILDSYLGAAREHLDPTDTDTRWVLAEWETALNDLRTDPSLLRDRADWAAKWYMLGELSSEAGRWDQDLLRSAELEYHDVDPSSSLFQALVDAGAMQTLVSSDRIRSAMGTPPSTRAALRGSVVDCEADGIEAIGWRRAVVRGEVIEFEIEGTE